MQGLALHRHKMLNYFSQTRKGESLGTSLEAQKIPGDIRDVTKHIMAYLDLPSRRDKYTTPKKIIIS